MGLRPIYCANFSSSYATSASETLSFGLRSHIRCTSRHASFFMPSGRCTRLLSFILRISLSSMPWKGLFLPTASMMVKPKV